MLDIINELSASNRAMGWMALDMQRCAEEERWYPALTVLFVLMEQSVRWATDAPDRENLFHILNRAYSEKLITENELAVLHSVRNYRNKYLHADFHATGFESDGLIYLISEEETAELIFKFISIPCMKIVLKLNKVS